VIDKKVYKEAFERSEGGGCEICGSYHKTELHHIIGGNGKRRQCERIESVLFLCWSCHHGDYGIEGKYGSGFDLELKLKLQETYYSMGMKEDEVRKWLGGKTY